MMNSNAISNQIAATVASDAKITMSQIVAGSLSTGKLQAGANPAAELVITRLADSVLSSFAKAIVFKVGPYWGAPELPWADDLIAWLDERGIAHNCSDLRPDRDRFRGAAEAQIVFSKDDDEGLMEFVLRWVG